MSSHGTSNADLHDLIERRQWRSACLHLEAHPTDAAIIKSINGADFLPIHKACKTLAPAPVVRALLGAHPDGARTVVSTCGYLPLHYACLSSQVTEDTVKLLLDVNPAAASQADNAGMLPLHHACRVCAPRSIIDLLLSANPEAMHIQDNTYSYPLDYVKTSSNNKNKLELFKALEHGQRYVDISKAAAARTTKDYENKITKLTAEHKATLDSIQKNYDMEKKRADELDGLLNKSDVKMERAKVDRLTKDIEGLKAAFNKECDDYKSKISSLDAKLSHEIKSKNDVSAELAEANATNAALLDNEVAHKADMDNLRTDFENMMLTLQETSTDRDVAKDCIVSLEERLSTATDRATAVSEENHTLKEALRSMHAKMVTIVTEREEIKKVLASRNAELMAFVALHEGLTKRALACNEGVELLEVGSAEDKASTKDIVDIVLGGDMAKDVTSIMKDSKEVSVQTETEVAEEHTVVTKSSSSADPSSTNSGAENAQTQAGVPATVDVPLQEKSLGSLVLEKLPQLSFV